MQVLTVAVNFVSLNLAGHVLGLVQEQCVCLSVEMDFESVQNYVMMVFLLKIFQDVSQIAKALKMDTPVLEALDLTKILALKCVETVS
mgnify:CR=1 FL=1